MKTSVKFNSHQIKAMFLIILLAWITGSIHIKSCGIYYDLNTEDDSISRDLFVQQIKQRSQQFFKNFTELDDGSFLLDSALSYRYYDQPDSVLSEKSTFIYNLKERTSENLISYYYPYDSTTTYYYGKILLKYDDSGNEIVSEYYQWNEQDQSWMDGLWYYSGHYAHKYDDKGRNTETTQYNYVDGKRVDVYKSMISYNENGQITERREYTNYDTGVLELKYINKAEFISEGNATTEISKYWTKESGKFQNSDKALIVRDDDGNIVETANYYWDTDNNKWVGKNWTEARTISTYDENNLLILKYSYRWNTDTDSWEKRHKNTKKYDSKKRIVQTEEFSWNGAWNLNAGNKTVYREIDSSGYSLMETNYSLYFADHYETQNRKLYSDGTNLETSQYEYQKWNATDKKWERHRKNVTINNGLESIVKSWDYNETSKDWILTYLTENKFDEFKNLIHNRSYRLTNNEFQPWSSNFYFYTKNALGLDANHAKYNDFKVYPNPSSGMVYFENANYQKVKISVYSLNGTLEKQLTGKGIQQMNLEDLQPGVYIVHLADGEQQKQSRVLIH